ncbi:hypothetical protein TIFTF001_036544 [Ficus carica]|uniref:Uncharacterized protein n=1 Tax=Ficus carica TaxID=3494 RepID=A0AA88E3Y9_FICCA|nr:hypothetical protein TIFTF001_036544 [Ficus carica]
MNESDWTVESGARVLRGKNEESKMGTGKSGLGCFHYKQRKECSVGREGKQGKWRNVERAKSRT